MNVPAGRYTVRPGLTLVEMLAAGRKIRYNGSAHQFADLPFAKDVEGWTVGGLAFLWAGFNDGSYWCWHQGSHYGLIPHF